MVFLFFSFNLFVDLNEIFRVELDVGLYIGSFECVVDVDQLRMFDECVLRREKLMFCNCVRSRDFSMSGYFFEL